MVGAAHGHDFHWVAASKLEPGRPNIDLVYRARLINLLDRALETKLALVIAPAGFGKTTLVGQWSATLTERGVKTAWLALEPEDSHVNQFLAYVVLALAHAGIPLDPLEIGARTGFFDSPPQRVVSNLIQRLHESPFPCVLVLDDFHVIESEDVRGVVKRLVRDAPDTFSLIITSRTRPAIDAPKLIASGSALEIGADDLRLNRGETIAAAGETISDGDANDIYEKTEGWPVAVQLARLQKQAHPGSRLQVTASDGLIASYLTEQVLSSLDGDLREFLLLVSVLDRFNTDLADTVRGQDNSWTLLDQLSPMRALLLPFDQRGDWYRPHHLFAEYLRDTLRRTAPERLQAVYRIASAWHAQRSEVIDAVKYAAWAGDYVACEQLILGAGGWKIILTEGIGVLRSLLRYVPDEVVNGSPRLLIARSYLHCKDGKQQKARALLDAAATLAHEGDTDAERDAEAVGSMLNVYEDTESWVSARHRICSRGDALAQLDPLEAGTLRCEEVLLHFAIGDFAAAASALKSAFGFMRQSGSVLGLNYCYLHAGVSALYRGELDLARANINRALEMAEGNFGSDSGLKHVALVLHYACRVWRGEAAWEDLAPFSETLSYVEEYDGWTEIYIVGLDAAFNLARQCDHWDFAQSLVTRFLAVAQARNLARLERFAGILAYSASAHAGQSYSATRSRAEIVAWLARRPDGIVHGWQSNCVGAASLADRPNRDHAETALALDSAIEAATLIGADLYVVRLRIAKAALSLAEGNDDEARRILANATKSAVGRGILGPFLCDQRLAKTIKEVRDELRHDEQELLAAAAISELLAKSAQLRPKRMQRILSDREHEIMERLAGGKTNKEIARQLELTENTVKFHLKNVFAKLGVSRRTQAISELRRLGLIE